MAYRSINQYVLANAPCSVEILVDKGLSGSNHLAGNQVSHHVAVLFFGGPDDREALCYGWRMVPVLILLLGKKLRLKRLELLGAATEEESELFVLPWRSWSCIRPCSCLVENNGPCCEWCSSNND